MSQVTCACINLPTTLCWALHDLTDWPSPGRQILTLTCGPSVVFYMVLITSHVMKSVFQNGSSGGGAMECFFVDILVRMFA